MSLKRKFVNDALYYAISSGITRLFGLITLPILTKNISADLYGIWVQITVTIILLLSIITFGFQASIIRFTSGQKDNCIISTLFHLMLGIVIFNGLVFVSIAFYFQNYLSNLIFADVSFHRFVPLTGIWLMAEAIYTLNISFMRSKNKIKLLSLINVFQSLLKFGILYIFLIIFSGNLESIIVCYSLALILSSIGIYVFCVVRTVGMSIKTANLKNTLKDLLQFSIPFIPNGALMWILASSDRYFIVHLLGLPENAVYSAAYGLVQVLTLFYMPLGFVAYPYLVEFWDIGQKGKVKEVLDKSNKFFVFFVIPSIHGMYILGSSTLLILATDNYFVSPLLILWISLGVLFLGFYQINVYIIHLIKKTHYNTVSFFIAALINIILNYLLIRNVGVDGAAISTAISYFVLALIVITIAKKELNYNFDYKFMLKCIIGSVIMSLVIKQIEISNIYDIIISIILGIIVYITSVMLMRCFTDNDIREITSYLGISKRGSGGKNGG